MQPSRFYLDWIMCTSFFEKLVYFSYFLSALHRKFCFFLFVMALLKMDLGMRHGR